MAFTTAGAALLPGTASAQPFQTGQYYQLIAAHSNKALDIAGISTEPGAILQQWDSSGGQNQHFRFESSGDGYYRVIARHSNLALDVFEWNADNGADIVQWTDLDGENQQWTVIDHGNNEISLINRFSDKALDVWEVSQDNGARVSQYDYTGNANQRFQLVPVDGGGGEPPPPPPPGDRPMENLDRGVVAVRSSDSDVLVSWRLLGLDPDGIGFNVYRSAGGGSPVQLNSSVLTGGTNFVDSTANLGQSNTYHVRPVVNGAEQEASGSFTLAANNPVEPVVRVPLRSGGPVKFLWVGDLTGDGEYDFVIDRQTSPQTIEAYQRDGTFLWEVNMGPNSTNQNNISPGSSTLNVGHWDGMTVYDFNSDGRAEVAVRIANGVTFGDGTTFNHSNNDEQFIAFLDGQTGALRAHEQIPTDYISFGPLAARFGVGYLDGARPHLIAHKKNRLGGAGTGFNLMQTAWTFDGNSANMEWKWLRNQNAPDGHNSRAVDVSGDGADEVVEMGFVLNGDGSLRYTLGDHGIIHGDRFHVAKMDPNRPGLQGYGVQQGHPGGLLEYYYDANDGTILWENFGQCCPDVGRGMVGAIDPRFTGMEMWSFFGVYNATTLQLTEPNTDLQPWPQLGLWWDGELTMDLLNDGKFEKWTWDDPRPTNGLHRHLSTWHYGAVNASQGVQPLFVGDILGDWREEAVYTNAAFDELIIFTTDHQTDVRLYTLAHNPAYRNAMTFKGYMQSHHVDYYLGPGMSTPPTPNITYVGD